MNVAGVILASGSGSRTGLDVPKQFLKIAGQPVLFHTIRAFVRCRGLGQIVVVGNPAYMEETKRVCDRFADSRITVVPGESTRQRSSLQGIMCCANASHVIIHDGVRALITPELITRVLEKLRKHDAIDVCIPAADTIVVQSGGYIKDIPARASMMLGQTPQAFRRDLILRAHAEAMAAGISNATDDCSLVLRLGEPIFIEHGDRANMKITYLDDIYLVERLFQVARLCAQSAPAPRPVLGPTLVIGGTSGIGKGIVLTLQARGVRTTVVSRRTTPSVDVTSADSINRLVSRYLEDGVSFDNIIYCAGTLIRRMITDYSETDWDRTIATNVKGVFLFLRQVKKVLQPGGHFVVLGSSSYSLGRASYAPYSASKAALVNLIQAAADEYPEFHFNVVSPQAVESELRTRAFGAEAVKLLNVDEVATSVVEILGCDLSGMNLDIRVDAPLTFSTDSGPSHIPAPQISLSGVVDAD